ncbi:hypothetical protein GDO81_009484 [Engystomops pustulosus]|uniref:Uncharacterized protein n=1 Tax=Engystomops pustulosus TaxID=76066 RepID=A0AAV7BR95_ENGPU|nr:hypothetical protein GDO81_009484 [Engystomops pustulosus]
MDNMFLKRSVMFKLVVPSVELNSKRGNMFALSTLLQRISILLHTQLPGQATTEPIQSRKMLHSKKILQKLHFVGHGDTSISDRCFQPQRGGG